MARRFNIKEVEPYIGDGREFLVWKGTVPEYMAFRVSLGSDDKPRCGKCSGALTAMLASCPHAMAVKRFVAKEQP